MIDTLQNLNMLGLLYDGVGVIVLGFPSLMESPKDTHRETATHWDANEYMTLRLVRTKFDTFAGSVFLFAGFVLQFLATLKIQGVLCAVLPLWVLAIVLPITYFVLVRSMLVARYIKSVAAEAKKAQP